MTRNVMERCIAAAALLVLLPMIAAAAIAVAIGCGRPVLFRQKRIGMQGRAFEILKFRSMRTGKPGKAVTAAGDPRITTVGRWIRRYKLDELPQLWNVVRGDMQLVGPRPEVADYVNSGDPVWASILAVRPGITDPATLLFRNEEEVLAQVTDPLTYYRTRLLPEKLAISARYQRSRTFWTDILVLSLTAFYSLAPAQWSEQRLRKCVFLEV